MNTPIRHQIIKNGGKPLFVLVPYETYIETMYKLEVLEGDEVSIPQGVVDLSIRKSISPIRAWREYNTLTQKTMAQRMKISQSAYSQMEKPGVNLRQATLKKIADVLKIRPDQLKF